MLEIPFNFWVPGIRRGNYSYNEEVKINDDWNIVIPLKYNSTSYIFNSVEFRRKNMGGVYLVFGELKILRNHTQLAQTTIAQFVENGSTSIKRNLNTNVEYYYNTSFQGVLKIIDISERFANKESKFKMQLKSLAELSSDFEKLLRPEFYYSADVILICNGVSIPAHKNVLSARSPVFAAVFAQPMSPNNEVYITDMDESVLRLLLKYVYTGNSSDFTASSAAHLLSAAHKYQIQDLKAVCSFFLKAAVSPDNVWQILVLGDMYCPDLKTFAVDYICKLCGKFSDVRDAQEWKKLRKERPELAMDLLESLVKHREEKLNTKN